MNTPKHNNNDHDHNNGYDGNNYYSICNGSAYDINVNDHAMVFIMVVVFPVPG